MVLSDGNEKSILILLALVTVGVALYFTKNHLTAAQSSAFTPTKVGLLHHAGTDVTRKFAGENVFQKTLPLDAIFSEDTVFVGAKSQATLEVPDACGEFLLNPNTMAEVTSDKMGHFSRPRIKLLQGKIFFKKTNCRPGYRITAENQTVVEVADNTLVGLDGQDKITFQKNESGTFVVSDATTRVIANIFSYNSNNQLSVRQVVLEETAVFMAQKVALEETVLFSDQAVTEPQGQVQAPREIASDTPSQNVNLAQNVQMKPLDLPATPSELEKQRTTNPTRETTISTVPIAEVSPEEKHFKRSAVVTLQPYYGVFALTTQDRVTGTSGTVASQYNIGLIAAYNIEWTRKFQSALSIRLGQVAFEKPTETSKKLDENQKLVSGIGLGLSTDFSDRLNVKLGFNYQKELFVRATSTQSFTVDAIDIPSLDAKVSYDLTYLDPFIFGIGGEAKAEFPAKSDGYAVKFGTQYAATAYLRQYTGPTDEAKFQTDLSIYRREQNTDIANQNEFGILLGLKFFFPIGRKEQAALAP